GSSGGPSGSSGGGGNRGGGGAQAALSEAQAEQVLRSIGQQELKTRRDRSGQTRRAVEPGVKDW
ncbi:MAG TPA: hypothetical protein VGV12_12165, partial [Gemmatimonadales bacterium]|nr:hypothetical protein [Gemmatimonadales bacterium]